MAIIRKAQSGVSMAKRDSIKAANKARIDATLEARAKKYGFNSREDYFKWQESRQKGPDVGIEGLNSLNSKGTKVKESKSCGPKAPCKGGEATGLNKAKDGKWIQKAAASIKRRGTAGKCTPITKPGCTGKSKTLAKTFKAIAKKNKK